MNELMDKHLEYQRRYYFLTGAMIGLRWIVDENARKVIESTLLEIGGEEANELMADAERMRANTAQLK